MVDAESAKSAIQDPNPVIDGRKANVNLAYIGAKPRATTAAGEPLNSLAFAALRASYNTEWNERKKELLVYWMINTHVLLSCHE